MSYTLANLFILKRDKAPFKRLMKCIRRGEQLNEISMAKTISSIVTHILIEMEGSETSEEAKSKAIGYRLNDWVAIQTDLIEGELTSEEAFNSIEVMLNEN